MAIIKATLDVIKIDEADYPNQAAAQADFDLITDLVVQRLIDLGTVKEAKNTRKKPLVPGNTTKILPANFPETLAEMSAGQKRTLAEADTEMRYRRLAREQHRYVSSQSAGNTAETLIGGIPIG